MLALANPRPAATSGGRCRPPRSRRSSTLLPSHLLSGYANGPDAGHAPSRLMRAMTAASTRGSHHGGSGAGCGVVGASAEEEEEDGEADGSAAAAASSFENVFLGGCGYNGDEDDDDDAIPLVALSGAQVRAKTTGVGKMKGRMMMEQQEPDDDDQQQQQQQQKENGRRRKRVYRYVSHGIGGAGNFRKCAMGGTTSKPPFSFLRYCASFTTLAVHHFPPIAPGTTCVLAALSLDPISWIETTSGIAVACDVVFRAEPYGWGPWGRRQSGSRCRYSVVVGMDWQGAILTRDRSSA